jgi:prefoldin subunit 5
MALSNAEVLDNLKNQIQEVTTQLNQLTETRLKLIGAIDVLEQIEDSQEEETEKEAPGTPVSVERN